MPGQPKWHAFLARMERGGGDEVVLEKVANGQTLLSLARELGVSRWTLRRYLKQTSERWERYQQALRLSAAMLAEEALEMAEAADPSSYVGVQRAKLEAETCRWLASVRDPVNYGKAPARSIGNADIGSLHLEALRKHGGPEAQAARPDPPERMKETDLEDAELTEE